MTPVGATSAATVKQGTTITKSQTCPAGTFLLSGGAQVSTNDRRERVMLVESYPSSNTTWTATAIALTNLENDRTMTVTVYALCSLPPP